MKRASFSVNRPAKLDKARFAQPAIGIQHPVADPAKPWSDIISTVVSSGKRASMLAGLTVEFLVNAQDAVPEFRLIDKERRLRVAIFPELMAAAVGFAEQDHEAVPGMVGQQIFRGGRLLPDRLQHPFQDQIHAPLIDVLDDGGVDRMGAHRAEQLVVELRRMHAAGIHEGAGASPGKSKPLIMMPLTGSGGNVHGTEIENDLASGLTENAPERLRPAIGCR